jgi:hypothetical protein
LLYLISFALVRSLCVRLEQRDFVVKVFLAFSLESFDI